MPAAFAAAGIRLSAANCSEPLAEQLRAKLNRARTAHGADLSVVVTVTFVLAMLSEVCVIVC